MVYEIQYVVYLVSCYLYSIQSTTELVIIKPRTLLVFYQGYICPVGGLCIVYFCGPHVIHAQVVLCPPRGFMTEKIFYLKILCYIWLACVVGGAQGVGCMARYSNFNIENIQYLRNFLENKCNNWHRPSWLDVDCNVGELMWLAVFF